MTAEHLLHELETVAHAARIRHMVALGSQVGDAPQLAEMLMLMEQGDFYKRFLALHACFGSRDGAHVQRALIDPSRIIRGVAIRLAPLACNERQLRQALALVPHDGRRPLIWELKHHGQQPVIDAFLEQLAATDDPQLLQLLPYGSDSVVRQHITQVQPLMRLADWRRLARLHPTIACVFLKEWADSLSGLDLQLVAFANGILPMLAKQVPDETIMLVATLKRFVALSRMDLTALLVRRPAQLADLVLQDHDDLGLLHFSTVAEKLDNERLIALYKAYPEEFDTLQWLRRIPPERRAELYTFCVPPWRNQGRYERISAEVLALLPRSLREREGCRFLNLSSLALYPQERLTYAGCLPWDEASAMLGPFVHDPVANMRSTALQALIGIVRYDRTHLPAILDMALSHLDEPDPIRYTILDSLSKLPRDIWRTEHLASLERLFQGVSNAFDSSNATIGMLFWLITRLLTCAPEWSATWFARVAQAHGITFPYGCIDHLLSETEVRQLGPALHPVLLSWAEQGDEEQLQPLLQMFGKRVRVFEELLDALEVVFSHKISFEFGNQILLTLTKYRPARAAQRIPDLLKSNRDWITYPAVLGYLLKKRQDLLTPFLKHTRYLDLFHDVHAGIVYKRWRKRGTLPLTRGYASWTTRQQVHFARTLRKVILSETNDHERIGKAIVRLFSLPAIPDRHRLALTKNQQPVLRDLALIHLRLLDNATPVLPTLLEAFHDERAVRAIYALRRWLLRLPPPQALALLRTVPRTKVTIAREVVRLLAEIPGEEAFQELLALDQQELHRDVRVALVRALGRHLERDDAWSILEREVGSANKIIAVNTAHLNLSPTPVKAHRTRKRVLRTSDNGYAFRRLFHFSEWNTVTMAHLGGEHRSMKAQQRLMRLFALLLARPELDVKVAVVKGATRLPAADEGQVLLIRLLEVMENDDEEICEAAANAIFGTIAASDAAVIEQVVRQFLPNRRALHIMISALKETHPMHRLHLIPITRAMIAALSPDPLTIHLRLELALAFLPWNEGTSMLEEAAATNTLHADALHHICSLFHPTINSYGSMSRLAIHEIIHLEEKLATSNDERLRRIALAALVAQANECHGWNAERRARLESYRADPSPLVAAVAQFTVIPRAEV